MHSKPYTLIDNTIATDIQTSETSLFESDMSNSSNQQTPMDNLPSDNIPTFTRTIPEPVSFPPQRMSTSFPNPFNSVLTMPIPGTKLAPEKFRGDFHKVKEFIQHYERLCAQNNVTADTDKCDTLLRYCSKREKQTIKNISSFRAKSWGRLREDILRLYDADLDTRRYKVKDVRNFSRKQKTKKIRDLAGWKKYCRAFLRIAGSLLSAEKITEKEYATYLWQGIPKPLRVRLENRILTRNPVRDLSEPFSPDEIDTAAAAVLQRDRFDTAFDDSDSEADSSDDDESSGSDFDSSSESESEDEREKRKRRAKKRVKTKDSKPYSSGKEDKYEMPKKRTVKGPQREVESLIRQMNLLTQDDPQYGIAYYRALKLDPDVSRIVAEPALRRPCDQRYGSQRRVNYQQPAPQQVRGPTIYNSQPSPRMQPQPPPRGSEMTCYGCGEIGHGMGRCPSIADLIGKDILAKDSGGRIVYKDGSTIRRLANETYLQAYEREQREQRPKTHLITIANESDDSDLDSDDNDEAFITHYLNATDSEESDQEDVFAIREVGWKSMVADRPEKKIAARQKMVMDGVYPPKLKDLAKGKENRPVDAETGRPIRPGKNQAPKASNSKEPVQKQKKTPEPVPMEIHKPRYDASKDAQIIEDPRVKKKDFHKRPENDLPEEGKMVEKRFPRRSAVSEQVNVMGVLDHVLNAKVELAVGEIIGVSRELSGQLANVIKFRPGKHGDAVGLTTFGNSFRTKTRGLLIKITLECDGNPIEAIIDTGSQLNIVNEKICKSKIRRPIDCTASLSMNDANGGEGKLNGMVENVPLEYGGVTTRANLFVGAHVPFDLLLGRPWQRGNLVSIDELEDGTYLVFKDPSTKEPKHKVLVTPDAIVTEDWAYDPSTWFAKEQSTSYFVDCGSANDAESAPDSEEEGHVPWSLRRDYPNMEQWEFPSVFLGQKKDMNESTRKIVKPWLQKLLLRLILKPPNRVPEWSDERQGWIIKE
jgi:hypothetical protein